MNETQIERIIDNKTDLIINILFRNDFKGVLFMDMEEYDDMNFMQNLPPKASPIIMRQELNNVMRLIGEVRELAQTLNNLDLADEINEEMDILEKDRRKVFQNIETENENKVVLEQVYPVELTILAEGGNINVFDWA